MEFVFVAKKPITQVLKVCIEADIARANIENNRIYSRIHSRCNRHGISWIIKKIPILSTLPDEAKYFKDNDLFEYVRFGEHNSIMINVSPVAISKMEMAGKLGADDIRKAKAFFLQKFGFKAPQTLDSIDKMREELVKALKQNGVEVNG